MKITVLLDYFNEYGEEATLVFELPCDRVPFVGELMTFEGPEGSFETLSMRVTAVETAHRLTDEEPGFERSVVVEASVCHMSTDPASRASLEGTLQPYGVKVLGKS